MYTYTHTYIHTHKAHIRIHTYVHTYTHTHTNFIPDYLSGTSFYVHAYIHLRHMQLAICTRPAITIMSHMHSTASATC